MLLQKSGRILAPPQAEGRSAAGDDLIDIAQRRWSTDLARSHYTNWSDYLEAMMPVSATMLVDDVMRQWPMTIRAFLNHKMHCVGCPITCFHTISDACREHGVEQGEFLTELGMIIAQAPDSSGAREREAIAARWPA